MTRIVYVLARPVVLVLFALAGVAVASAQVTANPSSLKYGNVSVGLSATNLVALTNQGASAVTVQSITSPFPLEYGIGDGTVPATLAPNGGKKSYSIIFRPPRTTL